MFVFFQIMFNTMYLYSSSVHGFFRTGVVKVTAAIIVAVLCHTRSGNIRASKI